MKYTFCGDIHGKVDQVKQALSNEGQVIFVGDFMDSFDLGVLFYEECLTLVCDAIEKGKAQAIYGNHELSYMYQCHRCSGYNYVNQEMFLRHVKRVEQCFKYAIQIENWYITHAGIHPLIWGDYKQSGKSFEEWASDIPSKAHDIGKYRGCLPFLDISCKFSVRVPRNK